MSVLEKPLSAAELAMLGELLDAPTDANPDDLLDMWCAWKGLKRVSLDAEHVLRLVVRIRLPQQRANKAAKLAAKSQGRRVLLVV
jgi:hypothetical protein